MTDQTETTETLKPVYCAWHDGPHYHGPISAKCILVPDGDES